MTSSDSAYDVIVVGYGGAGGAAAIEAHDAGARVLVVEKAPAGGGNSQVAGGNIRIVRDADKVIEHFIAVADNGTDAESIEAHVRGLVELPAWIEKHGGTIVADNKGVDTKFVSGPPYCPREYSGSAFPGLPGADGLGGRYRWPEQDGGEKGFAVFAMLDRNVRGRGITALTDTAVESLVREADGRVSGIVASTGGGTSEHIAATQGVVLACGGYAWDPVLQRDVLGVPLPSPSPPHRNAGDGVRMAQAVGAGLWHMRAAVLQLGIVVPGYDASHSLRVRERTFVFVDREGNRFCDEARLDGHDGGVLLQDRDMRTTIRKRLPSYMVFDEITRLAGPIIGKDRGYNRGKGWTDDNGSAIENGWVTTAPTIEDLARELGLPPAQLRETVAAYNRSIEKGNDQFGRLPEDSLPIEQGPFYGVAIWPCIVNTQGGPRREPGGRVLDPWGEPIPGLYGAGELGSIWTSLYPGGGNFGEALVSGGVAGRAAATLGR